jgi:PHP family Zn ribbon phosphoesterase
MKNKCASCSHTWKATFAAVPGSVRMQCPSCGSFATKQIREKSDEDSKFPSRYDENTGELKKDE